VKYAFMADISSMTLGLSFSAVTIGVFVAMGFYAVKNLRGFKGGLLSKGWRYISIAVFFFIAGQFFLDSGAAQAINGIQSFAQYSITLGSLMETIGGFLLVLGFRAQNNVWKQDTIAAATITTATLKKHPNN
jgi:hypothetical protein